MSVPEGERLKMAKNSEDGHPKTMATFGKDGHLGPRDDFAEVD
jgi:hypothetical protein